MKTEKKKIRGWKRRKKNIANWKFAHLNLDKQNFETNSRDYVKLWLYPFDLLSNYKLPNWYKKLLVDSLIDIYYSWQQDIDMTNEYYLKIWLFEKNFMSSQVVIAKDDYINFYDDSFGETSGETALPLEMRTTDSAIFNWEQGHVINMYRESELTVLLAEKIMSNKEISKIKNSAYLVEVAPKDTLYYLKDEKVWIGEHLNA